MPAIKEQKEKAKGIEIPEQQVEARVTERQGDKTIIYTAKGNVQEKESEDQTDDTDSEADRAKGFDYNLNQEFNQEIPKTRLEEMFEQLQFAVEYEQVQNLFYARCERQVDGIGQLFNIPNNLQPYGVGIFTFTTRDLFAFDSQLQKQAGNTGGVFNIVIFTQDQRPLEIKPYKFVHLRGRLKAGAVGIVNYLVQNPPLEVKVENGNNQSGTVEIMREMIAESRQQFQAMLQQMQNGNRVERPEPSMLEKALEAKMMRDLTQPPENAALQMMQNFMTMPLVMQRMADKILPDTTPAEPDTVDKVMKFLDNPAIQNVATKLADVTSTYANAKINQKNPSAPVKENPTIETEDQTEPASDMQELMLSLLEELESDRPINAENELMIQLANDYPMPVIMLDSLCKTKDFNTVFAMLDDGLKDIEPHPFMIANEQGDTLLDLQNTNQDNGYIWTPRGERVMLRLQEFYEFMKAR